MGGVFGVRERGGAEGHFLGRRASIFARTDSGILTISGHSRW